MKRSPRHLVAAATLVLGASAALAQMPPPPGPGGMPTQARMGAGHEAMQQRLAARHERHLADLKRALALTPAQESAWTRFTEAMQPPPRPAAWPARGEFERLTTPERLERLQAMKAERDAHMARRADATRAFYAALDPAQQKTFDAETLRHLRERHGPRGGWHHGPAGGPPMGGPGYGPGPRP